MATRSFFSVRQFAERNPQWTESALRNLIFQAQPRHASRGEITGNGLAAAIIRRGRKVLIDEDKFFRWVETGDASSPATEPDSDDGVRLKACAR